MEKAHREASQPVWKFLAELQKLDLRVSNEEGRLRVSAPSGVLTAELREELTARKAEILDFLRESRVFNGEDGPLLRPVPRGQPLPLSFAQQRLWMVEQMNPGRSGYHVGLRLRLEGTLSLSALRWAIVELVRRHESLRTRFPMGDDGPVQEIATDWEPSLDEIDFSEKGSLERAEAEALLDAAREGQRAYDLAVGPLVRWRLYRLDSTRHLLWVGMHHIVTDGWSLTIICRELAELYEAAVTQRQPALSPLGLQYADFAVWQRSWLSGAVLQKQLDYWRRQLDGAAKLEFPADRAPLPELMFRGAGERFFISHEVVSGLKRLASEEGATLFMTLLAGLQVLLHRYTGQDDIVVGSPIANRNRIEVEGVVGFFVNALILRGDLSGNPSFRETLRRAREVTLRAYEFQDTPFEKLVEDLMPERSWGQSPFIQVMLSLQNLPLRRSFDAAGLKVSLLDSKALTTRFELEMHLWETDEGLTGQVVYNPDRFDADRVIRMIGHFGRLLEEAASKSDQPLSELPLLSEEEADQLLVEWNPTTNPNPSPECLHEVFDAWAERQPQSIAVVSGDEVLTFGELKERADKLAGYLQTRGAGFGSQVGICMERSPEMIVSILGIVKTGAAYLPLDPSYPFERLNFMVRDAEAKIVITDEPFDEVIAKTGAEIVCLDRDWPLVKQAGMQPTIEPLQPSKTVACVLYTSGSTGTPKGVGVLHQGVVHLVCNTNYVHLSPDDRMAHLSNVCFDATTFEIWGALLNGARLVVISKAVALDPRLLAEEIKRQRISALLVTTALLNELARANSRVFEGVAQVFFGGEAANAQRVRRVLEGGGAPRHLINLYGPTECTTVATFYPINDVLEGASTIPIGRPIANTRAYVLDRYRNPVPIGVPGELYLGGAGVAQGYLNQPQLMAEKFVADPFVEGGRLYRTGDIVKYLADGNIEFIGRVDNQVKIRGFRIEPGEVEVVLNRHPEVENAVVVVREDAPGERQLVAYLVQRAKGRANDWRGFLKGKLPSYMIPTAFVELEALPLTANGKLDRRALPKPQAQSTADPDAKLTPTEEIVRGVWAKVLGVPDLGVQGNFFEHGGHSLLAIQVVMTLRNIMHVEIPVTALFEHVTISDFSRYIEERVAQNLATVRPPIERVSRDQPLPLSFAQQRLWMTEQMNPGRSGYHVNLQIRLEGALSISALRVALVELVRRHESLRTRFPTQDDRQVQEIVDDWEPELQVIDLSQRGIPLEEREAEALQDAATEGERPYDLAKGPLVRWRLYKLNNTQHILWAGLHHIITDGWSLTVMYRELAELYENAVDGRRESLRPLSIQYADFAAWQRDWLSGEVLQKQLDYWREQLAGASKLEVPADRPPSAEGGFRGVGERISISKEVVSELKRLAIQEGATLFMTLLAGLQTLLHRYTGQEDIVIGSPIANRDRSEVEGLLGFFVNALVLRTDLSGDPTFREVLRRTREVTLKAYQFQDMPFEKLVEDLAPERSWGQNPFIQVMLSLQNLPLQRVIETAGIKMSLTGSKVFTSRFELEMHLWETEEGLTGQIVYNPDRFEADRIVRMIGHYCRLLEGAARDADRRLSKLPLLNEQEIDQVVVEWNRTATPYPAERCVHQEFERQAALQPDAVAVVGKGGTTLTYGELNDRSERLAELLRSEGVAVGSRVALCVDRSTEMIIGMLAILKAGGVYVPLDPEYPAERLALILKEVAAPVILTVAESEASLPPTGARVFCLDRDRAQTEGGEVQIPGKNEAVSEPTSRDLAYVIFTSGSTGVPKGVAVPHCAIMRLVLNTNYVELGSTDRIAHISNVCFDAATFEIWGALLNGASVVVVPKAVALDAHRFGTELERWKVSTLFVTTALFNELVAANDRIFQSVKQVLVGGEAVNPQSVRRSLESGGPPRRLLNAYGPTECTTFAIFYLVTDVEKNATTIPIGRPIANTTAYVLDKYGVPLPIGVPGELYLGGPGVAQGYLNQPELTAERFVADPFAADETQRLYRTGDIVKYLADGNIEFIGRVDNQVKIRGFRIEPGEVEVVLNRHPEVENAVVVVREDAPGERQLVAYLVQRAKGRANDWRGFLKGKLPSYMIPTAFVELEALPLTANGKLDRRALPKPQAQSTADPDAKLTPTEEIVRGVWAKVLGVPDLGVQGNFFEHGGHSLLAIQVVMTLRNIMHVEIPVTALFEHVTISDFSRYIEERVAQNLATVRPPIERVSRDQPLPLSFAQQRLWRNERAGTDSSNLNVMVFTIEGPLDLSSLERSLQELARRHEVFRSTFHIVDGLPVQRVESRERLSARLS